MSLPVPALYTDALNGLAQVSAYQVGAGLEFPPGPDLRRVNATPYQIWTGSGWATVQNGDWVVGASKEGSTFSNAAFVLRFSVVQIGL